MSKYLDSGATFSECRKYRYSLWRTWNEAYRPAMFVGLNPSTADEQIDDPTIRRCVAFAKLWRYGGIRMLNLFAWRATDPRDMKRADDPVGEHNDGFLCQYAEDAAIVVAAWGAHGAYMNRGNAVAGMLQGLRCFGVTKDGHPKHPLYLAANTPLQRFGVAPAVIVE